MLVTKWKRTVWKGSILCDSGKGKAVGTRKGQGWPGVGGGRGEQAEHGGFRGPRNYSEWRCDGGPLSLDLCPDPQNA